MQVKAKAPLVNLDDQIPNSRFFKWREALWLPRWGVFVFPDETQAANIIKLAKTMDVIRGIFNKPIRVTSWLRPENYNKWVGPYGVGGAPMSAHRLGMACDFLVKDVSSDAVREALKSELQKYQIRMESNPTPHVHVDIREPGGQGRYFKA